MALTNEQMFDLIKDGNEDLKPVLWERVKKLMYLFAGRYYSKYSDYCERHGVTDWDLKQQAYIAYENSFAGYDLTRGKYSNYLMLMFKASLRDIFQKKNPLDYADSLDRVLDTEDPNGSTVGDFVPDPEASEPFDQIEGNSERESISRTLHEAIAELDEREQAVINGKYFENKTFMELSEKLNTSYQNVSQIHRKAINHLRNPRIVRRLQDDLGYSSYRLYSGRSVEYIATERAYIEEFLKKREEEIARLRSSQKIS